MGLFITICLCGCQHTGPISERDKPTTFKQPAPVPGEAIALCEQASQVAGDGDVAKARELLLQAVERLDREGPLIDMQASRSFNRLVAVMRQISPAYNKVYPDIKVVVALDRLYGDLKQTARTGTHPNRIYLLMKLGNGYTEEGDFFSSLGTLRQAFVMASTRSKSSEDMEDYRAWSAMLVGKAYLRTDEIQKARRHTLMAIEIFRQQGKVAEQAMATMQLARVLSMSDAHEKALEQALEAQRQYQALLAKDREHYYPGYGQILQDLGKVYRRMEGYPQVISIWEQALTISNQNHAHGQADSREERLSLLAGLGLCYEETDNQTSADWAYGLLHEEVRGLSEPFPVFWSLNLGEIMRIIGRRLSHKGDFVKAAKSYDMARKAYQSVPNKMLPNKNALIANTQYARGVALYQSGQFAESEPPLIDSVKRLHKLVRNLPPEEDGSMGLLALGVALAELGQTLTTLERHRESEAVFLQAIRLLEGVYEEEPSVVREYIYALSLRAKMYEATKRYRLAAEDVEHCVQVYASLPRVLAERAEALVGMIYLQSALLARHLTGRTAGNSQVVRQRIKLGMDIAKRHPNAPHIRSYIEKLGLRPPEPDPVSDN
jgi:tetratricopeptide (TPR) repeat protein